jgi:hypothetical protein
VAWASPNCVNRVWGLLDSARASYDAQQITGTAGVLTYFRRARWDAIAALRAALAALLACFFASAGVDAGADTGGAAGGVGGGALSSVAIVGSWAAAAADAEAW